MSERVLAQPQSANATAKAFKDSFSLKHRETKQAEQTTFPELLFNIGLGTFAEPRIGFDFSRVPAFTAKERQAQPLLRTQPMVQRFPKDEVAGSAACPNCPEATSTEVSAPVEPEVETAEPTTEIPVTETETPPAPAEPETESAKPSKTLASALIVDDSATELGLGQMKKSVFLNQLQSEVCRAVEAAIAGTGGTTEDCPYLNHWFNFYRRQHSEHIERAIHRYAPEALGITTAKGYITVITQRARQSAETWARTGKIIGVPEGLPLGLSGMGLLGGMSRLFSGIGSIFFKAREGGARAPEDPQAIQAELGEGRSLDSGIRTRMQSAFGRDFSHVRAHTDTTAAGLSNSFNARAFTVGNHVAFGQGEYKPRTLVGDAIIAHELAHVLQQQGGSTTDVHMQGDDTNTSLLEKDADLSAASAVAALYGGGKKLVTEISQKAVHCLKTGLKLQRCRSQPIPSDYQIRGKIYAPWDTGNIYYDRGISDMTTDPVEMAKIPGIISTHGVTASLTLNGFRSEDEPSTLASARVDSVFSELRRTRTTAPAHPAHTGGLTPRSYPNLSVGHMNYRNWRKVEVLGTPTGRPYAPTRMPPPCPSAGIPCPPTPNAFTLGRVEALRLVNQAITALNPTNLSAASPPPTSVRAKTALRDVFGGTNRNAAVRQATGLGNAATVRSKLVLLRTHIIAMNAQHECRPACYGGCGARPAYNTGTGIGSPPAAALMTLCSIFFDTSRTLAQNANVLIHEGSHGTHNLATDDVAYGSARMFPFLTDTDALRNADSYVAFIRLTDAAGSFILGPPPGSRDIVSGMTVAEERAAREAVAHLEKWVLLAEFDTELLYGTINRSLPPSTAWASRPGDVFNRDTMKRIAPLFGLTNPGRRAPFTLPVERDKVRIASIRERFLQMRQTVLGRRLTINKVASRGSESWAAGSGVPGSGAGNTVSLSPATLQLGAPQRVRRVLELLVAVIPDISSAMQSKYVDAADRIRRHRRAGP